MHTLVKCSLIAGTVIGLTSCGGNSDKKTTNADSAAAPAPRAAVAVTTVPASPEFAGATLMIKSATAEKAGKDSAKVTFSFDVKNYELKAQTADGSGKGCANSAQGQHIHFIMDNAPYKALYEPKNEVTLANNTEHYLLCFLSRSYHESLKNKEAAVVLHFKIDEKGNYKKLDDPKEPMLFYSRPKGDYIGKDTASILLDFYVWNTTIAADGNKVKAQITNESLKIDTTIMVDTWAPHFIQNLGTGKGKVTLTLVGKDGQQVQGSMTTVSREFNMAAAEPVK